MAAASDENSRETDSIDFAMDGLIATSIEQLYNNLYDMHISGQSPSELMGSFLSSSDEDDDESRIDSELRFLAGADYGDPEQETSSCADQKTLPSPAKIDRVVSGKRKPRKNNKKTGSSRKPPCSSSSLSNDNLVGSHLLKQARSLISQGENPEKALDLALRALKSFEEEEQQQHSPSSKDYYKSKNLDIVMCMHVVAALYRRLGRIGESVRVLERSIEIPEMDKGPSHAIAKFAGCMQLGDTYAALGEMEKSVAFYAAGLEIQRQVLGENDLRLGGTCRYVAEAHVQAMQFDEAEKMCRMALEIRGHDNNPCEGAADRRLLGLILHSKGEYEGAIEQYVLASLAVAGVHGQEAEAATIECENHPLIASVCVPLADLYHRVGKFKESRYYCENALRVLPKAQPEVIASGLADLSAIYESMGEPKRALDLLHKANEAYMNVPHNHSHAIAGVEAQIGVLYYILGDYSSSYNHMKNAVDKFRTTGGGEKKAALLGIALNQMGLACVQLYAINEAADLFEEARIIFEAEYGPFHADTLGVYSNLAATYDAMGRTNDAIEILEFVVGTREDKLGTANPDVDDEKRRLAELLKEAGRVRNRKAKSLEVLLANKSHALRMC
ncbi:unnamed protein product [Cuscuta campestris]|uniref:MalT-like TPR region domain-containing protein n=1 Tax=Cuscuta campestris TaxID=132261 RepID=A0A484KBQ6_9ASTE|nr:unnamed protein product [Cuscuta campestris]